MTRSFVFFLVIIVLFVAMVVGAAFLSIEKKQATPFYDCTNKTIDCLFECKDKYNSSSFKKLSCGGACVIKMSFCNFATYAKIFTGKESFTREIKVKPKEQLPSFSDIEKLKSDITYEEFIKQEGE